MGVLFLFRAAPYGVPGSRNASLKRRRACFLSLNVVPREEAPKEKPLCARTGLFDSVAMSVSTSKKMKRETTAQRRPAKSERKNDAFSEKRQTVRFKTRSVSN